MHKYWLGIQAVKSLTFIFQIPSAIGAVVWYMWATRQKHKKGLFTKIPPMYIIWVFLMASLAWPWLLPKNLPSKPYQAILCCIPLWIASISVIMMVAGTFEVGAPTIPTVAVIYLAITVVLIDGIGWSAKLIHDSLNIS